MIRSTRVPPPIFPSSPMPGSCGVKLCNREARPLAARLITTLLEDRDGGTKVQMMVQVMSFCGDAMIRGTETGNNASLDNLVRLVSL